jgi:transcriptional regulator with PAS, ATPase and Fis domain
MSHETISQSSKKSSLEDHDALDDIVGSRTGLCEVTARARQLSKVDAPVLVQGETGVGKEVFARAIHQSGPCRDACFVALNCGGLSRELLASELFGYVDGAFTGARRSGMAGKIEAAHEGTLFLDEIAEMPIDLQPYLLRVLESGEVYPMGSNKPKTVRFRLIAACNRDLRAEAKAQRFRLDLFYRISMTTLVIPPLRERMNDLEALVEYFATQLTRRYRVMGKKRFAPEVLAAFRGYAWPGNLRELRNVVEAMLLLSEGPVVGVDMLPAELAAPAAEQAKPSMLSSTANGLADLEREAIDGALRIHRGNLTQAARDLCISRSTLYLKVKKYALEPTVNEVRVGPRQPVSA